MINIALGFDDKFARHGAVCVASVLSNTATPVRFYIMYEQGRLSDDSKNKIELILKQFPQPHSIEWIKVDGEKLKEGYTGHWSSAAVFYPLVLPQECPQQRILFLDADTVVTQDLTDLFETDLEGNLLAAVHDLVIGAKYLSDDGSYRVGDEKKHSFREYYGEVLGFTDEQMKRYFNSGMMLMDLEAMRLDNFSANTISLLSEYRFAFVDQDCLNCYCRDRVLSLPVKYNFLATDELEKVALTEEERKEICPFTQGGEVPTIIHYIQKPDLFLYKEMPRFHEIYWDYIRLTPYAKFARKSAYINRGNIVKWAGRLKSKEGRSKFVTTLKGAFRRY